MVITADGKLNYTPTHLKNRLLESQMHDGVLFIDAW